jgi:hypothetical protein
MKNEFVPYEQALVLKELGFDEPCLACYDKLNMLATYSENLFEPKNYNTSGYCVSAPLYQQAFRWFREKYNLYCFTLRQVGINTSDIFFISSYYKGKKGNSSMNTCIPSKTYEEAELACLIKLIEICKTTKL